jgi:hypothetical protein
MPKSLTIANHDHLSSFWEGGNYELNLSFDMLRDKQWQRMIQAIWEHSSFYGPLAERYTPTGEVPAQVAAQVPPPTATLTQHGQLKVGSAVIGCDVQATRSLFECVSILVPVGMFDGMSGEAQVRQEHEELLELDQVLVEVALAVYDVAPFKVGVIGYERGCQLPAELQGSADILRTFLESGNAIVHDDVLRSLHIDGGQYEQFRANLRWLAPQGNEQA